MAKQRSSKSVFLPWGGGAPPLRARQLEHVGQESDLLKQKQREYDYQRSKPPGPPPVMPRPPKMPRVAEAPVESLGDEKVAEVDGSRGIEDPRAPSEAAGGGAVEPPPMTLPQAVFRDKMGAPDPGAEIPEVVDPTLQHEEATISVTPEPGPKVETHLDIGTVRATDDPVRLPSPPTLQVEPTMLDSPSNICDEWRRSQC